MQFFFLLAFLFLFFLFFLKRINLSDGYNICQDGNPRLGSQRQREMEEFRAPQSDQPLRGDSKAIDEALEGEPEESHG